MLLIDFNLLVQEAPRKNHGAGSLYKVHKSIWLFHIYSFLRKVCFELRQAEEKFQDLMEKSVEERLANFLKLLLGKTKTKTFDLPLSREEIASLIGARQETVIRVFSSWKDQGYLKVHAKSLTLLDSSFLVH